MLSHKTQGPDFAADGEPHASLQSVERAITVLKILARTGGAGVSEVAEEMGVHRSTISRLLRVLEARGMAQQNTGRGKYQLGLGILQLANSIPVRLNLVREARPVLEALAAQTGETVNLAVLSSNYVVNVDEAMGPSTLATQDWIGRLTPIHATSSGKVFLAAMDAAERSRVLGETGMPPTTPRTITSRQDLEAQLVEVAEAGFATVYGELELGLNGIATPVFGHHGTVLGAISVSGPEFRFDPRKSRILVQELKHSAREVSRRMGHAEG